MAKARLLPDEVVVYDSRPHPLYFSLPALWFVPIIALSLLHLRSSGFFADVLRILLFPSLLIWVLWVLWVFTKWWFTRFTSTSYRVIWRTGVFSRTGVEIPLDRVSNVNFHQSFIERVLGAGDLIIESSGQDGQSKFSDIKHPDDVQLKIHAAISATKIRPATPAHPPLSQQPISHLNNGSLMDDLERLEAMYASGSLTAEEYAEFKRRLLG